MTAIVELEDVTRTFGEVTALSGVDLTIEEGEFVALVGPSGSGKSTILDLVAGLDRPSGGCVVVDGYLLDLLDEADLARFRRHHLGYASPRLPLLPELTLLDNLLLAARVAGTPASRARARALDLLERAGLSDRVGSRPAELSPGRRRRAAIVRAVVNQPPLLLVDEPTAGLDSGSGAEVTRLLAALRPEVSTIVVATAEPEVAGACTERVVKLLDGRVVEDTELAPALVEGTEATAAGSDPGGETA
ncbi:MAG TPA: ATP-binding cassette domain-containing protein [Candidatus Dormibacteraeota bacterium]|nr:ATP-binding cassette domain-containing protein [Candidatus Dormibacteraeota bacterium]